MSLLTLCPEATRLRRIAKACSAGELSRTEYREARRRVIDQISSVVDNDSDDTVPRFDVDVTQERSVVMSDSGEVTSQHNWLLWMLLGALLVAGLWLPLWTYAAQTGELIAPLNQRDPNPTTAPRYQVESVQLALADDLPVTLLDQAQDFLASRLKQVQQVNAPDQHGFNAAELQEVGRFLNAVGVHDKSAKLAVNDMQDLSALIAVQKNRRGVSLIQLEQIARELQLWLREQGYPLAVAYVPSQMVHAGHVGLGVQLGLLSNIVIAGPQSTLLSYRMAALVGDWVQRDGVETELNVLNRVQGIRVEASFVPGDQVGETEMVLQVKQQQRYTGSVQLDNYGVEDLGQERVVLSGQWNSPRGIGDVLSATAFTSIDPADHQFGQLEYASPVLDGRFDASARLEFADIALATGSRLEGDGILFDARLIDTQKFTRTRRREVTYGLSVHDFDWDLVPGQRAWFATAGVQGHRLWDASKIALTGSVQALFGGLDHQRAGQDDSFWRLRASMTGWTPFNLPWLHTRAKLVLDVQMQASADLLPPTLRLGASGPRTNKGFAQGQVLLDRGVGLNAALRFDAPLGQWWLFADSSYGEIEGVQKQWRQLSSVGVGWEAKILHNEAGRLSSRITLGYPISHRGSGGFDDDGTQFYWSLQYAH